MLDRYINSSSDFRSSSWSCTISSPSRPAPVSQVAYDGSSTRVYSPAPAYVPPILSLRAERQAAAGKPWVAFLPQQQQPGPGGPQTAGARGRSGGARRYEVQRLLEQLNLTPAPEREGGRRARKLETEINAAGLKMVAFDFPDAAGEDGVDMQEAYENLTTRILPPSSLVPTQPDEGTPDAQEQERNQEVWMTGLGGGGLTPVRQCSKPAIEFFCHIHDKPSRLTAIPEFDPQEVEWYSSRDCSLRNGRLADVGQGAGGGET
ncbi:hypothetical protein GALMADRAFT_216853 [Galerina marginata CBS 339.88]|uniref:Uncharacterized protein n=1 Tax=Galerina marginata (strain CBS 339.88) TaxID=685588 RepID=A0A067SA77_GALM3|nr:hypothetical protein GALMADRAFT_216853 [Galerina marginata CBS 339.88]